MRMPNHAPRQIPAPLRRANSTDKTDKVDKSGAGEGGGGGRGGGGGVGKDGKIVSFSCEIEKSGGGVSTHSVRKHSFTPLTLSTSSISGEHKTGCASVPSLSGVVTPVADPLSATVQANSRKLMKGDSSSSVRSGAGGGGGGGFSSWFGFNPAHLFGATSTPMTAEERAVRDSCPAVMSEWTSLATATTLTLAAEEISEHLIAISLFVTAALEGMPGYDIDTMTREQQS